MPGVFTSEFDLGDRVLLVTDTEERIRIVTGVRFPLGGGAIYQLSQGTVVTEHYPEEIRRPTAVEALPEA